MKDYKNIQKINYVQNRLIRIAILIKNVLEQNNIPYFITYGTLLGAVRHHGFIPWDDDFDFALFEESYDEAIKLLSNNLPSDLLVENESTEPHYFHDWVRIKDKNTIASFNLFPQDDIYICKGIAVDLFKVYKISENEIPFFKEKKINEYLDRLYKNNLINLEEKETKKVKYLKSLQDKNYDDNRVVFVSSTNYCIPLMVNNIFPLIKYKFENTFFLGPYNPKPLLESWYGKDYMVIPPPDLRISHYDQIKFIDTNEIYIKNK